MYKALSCQGGHKLDRCDRISTSDENSNKSCQKGEKRMEDELGKRYAVSMLLAFTLSTLKLQKIV